MSTTMKQSVGTGWAIGAIALILLVIGLVYALGSRTKPLHATPVQAMGRPIPSQQFVPKYTGP